jgi:hypothetical protein
MWNVSIREWKYYLSFNIEYILIFKIIYSMCILSYCFNTAGFRIIVVVEQDYAYRELDLPMLNRFEKQVCDCYFFVGKGRSGEFFGIIIDEIYIVFFFFFFDLYHPKNCLYFY